MAATRTIPGAAPSAPLTKAQRKAAAQQSGAAPLAHKGQDPNAVVVETKTKEEGSSNGRPDKSKYDAEQDDLRSQIDAVQAKLNDLKNKISASSNRGGPDHERKVAIRKELDTLRGEQARMKGGRGKTLDQLKNMQETMNKKVKDLNAAKAKVPYKTAQDVDNQIKSLERQVESGSMKLVDEKKALAEISSLRKHRKTVESFSMQQAAIDADKAKIDEVRKELDDPEQKAASKKFDELRKELDEVNKRMEDVSKNRDGLFEERNALSKQLDELWQKKKASATAFREANNAYYQKLEAERAKRDERRRAERKEYEDSKRAEINERLLEEAQAPAFEREIEDCQTLIRFFQQRIGLASNGSSSAGGLGFNRPKVAIVPELELRKVEQGDFPKGAVPLKKKSEQEEESWGGLASKSKKGRKQAGGKAGSSGAADADANNDDEKLNLPFGTLSGLMALGIPAPLTTGEVQKTIDSLLLKKKYFTDNQSRVTKERVAAVQAKIAAAQKNGTQLSEVDAVAATESSAKEEAIKDAQPQPIENGGSKEEAVENAEGVATATAAAAAASSDATPDAPAEEEKEEGEIDDFLQGYERQVGIFAVQVDEPAIREGLPRRQVDWDAYLTWAVDSFKLSTAGVENKTQIHSHFCYSDFGLIFDHIKRLDADVISVEASKSDLKLLEVFHKHGYENLIGPGLYDIHSPRVPSVQEMKDRLAAFMKALPDHARSSCFGLQYDGKLHRSSADRGACSREIGVARARPPDPI
ncbi:hypothetical protein JCM10908_004923 [Rhodotorula pacifica]|uniref:uncharacterized protein n=1 Tax=Rhodotorula pacifica TaxID=1495444 RepID=UPI00317C1B33